MINRKVLILIGSGFLTSFNSQRIKGNWTKPIKNNRGKPLWINNFSTCGLHFRIFLENNSIWIHRDKLDRDWQYQTKPLNYSPSPFTVWKVCTEPTLLDNRFWITKVTITTPKVNRNQLSCDLMCQRVWFCINRTK